MKIDWDAIHERLPIYAYEYVKRVNGEYHSSEYWYLHEHKGEQPPAGWTAVDRETSNPELWIKAANEWVKEVLQPNEKAVWFNTADGHFSNTFCMGEFDKKTQESFADPDAWERGRVGFKLIVYRCENDPDFEFTHLMKIVTKTKEERKL